MAATTNQTLPVGTAVGGQCVIERHLRNGVMTEVYRARREGSGRERFEVRRFTLVASSDALRAVRRELDRIEALHLPAIPPLVDVIDDPVGLLVVTSTAPEGATSLRQTLDAAGSLAPDECVRVVRVVASVLDVLHGSSPQVLHRRLSPDTIALEGPHRDVRVEECGLAQALVDAGLVNPRVALQARQYLSPDELLQRPSPRGDIFALASVAFECLTGRAAFLGATEASLSAAILRGARPSACALRPELPAAVDQVLARAWAAEASKGYLSAAALADALAQAIGKAGVAARPAPEPTFASPPAGTPVLSAAELNLMKSTILGVGTPSRPPAGVPRAKPTEAEKHALKEPEPMVPTRSRLVGGRPQMPTQKVEVPRIHPPGTERVAEEAERPTFPPARLPPTAAVPARASDKVTADLFNIADIDAFDIAIAPHPITSSLPPKPSVPPRASAPPPPIPRVPSRSPTIMRSSVPPAVQTPDTVKPTGSEKPVLLQPEPEAPSTEVTFEMDAEIPASVVDAEDSWDSPPAAPEPPPRPASMPALPRSSPSIPKLPSFEPPPPVADFSPVDEIDPEPPVGLELAPDTQPESDVEPDREPSLPTFAIPAELAAPPAMTPVVEAPAAPAVFRPVAPVAPSPPLADVAPPPAVAARFEPPAYLTQPDDRLDEAPAMRPDPLAKWRILGASIVAAAAIVTGGQIYLAKTRVASVPPRDVRAVLVPAATPPAAVVPTPTPAAVPAVAADAAVAAADALAVAAVGDAALAAADVAAVVDGGSAGVAEARPVVEVDASAPAAPVGGGGWDVAIFGASNDPMREHPRRRDVGHLEGALEPEVRRCIGPATNRHVRMTVVYEGTTGRPREVRIVGAFAQPPVGTCLETLMRAHPVPPFTDPQFESNFIFSTTDDEEED